METRMKMASENVLVAFKNVLVAFEGYGAEKIRKNEDMFTLGYERRAQLFNTHPAYESSNKSLLLSFMGNIKKASREKNDLSFAFHVGLVTGAIDYCTNLSIKNAAGDFTWSFDDPELVRCLHLFNQIESRH